MQISVFPSAEALLCADWQRFSILFLDVVMQRQDGVSAAAEIRRKNPDVSLIFVSAFLDYAAKGYQVKASAYFASRRGCGNALPRSDWRLRHARFGTFRL